MERDQIKQLIIYITLTIALIGLIVFGVWKIYTAANDTNSGENRNHIAVLPTEKPSVDPNAALLCKNLYDGLKSSAEKNGAEGMLIIDRNFMSKDGCQFEVKKMTVGGKSDFVQTIHDLENRKYGITLKLSGNDEKQNAAWSKAALLYFNKDIDENTADEAIQKGLTGETVESDLFSVRMHSEVDITGGTVTPVKVIEITGQIPEDFNP